MERSVQRALKIHMRQLFKARPSMKKQIYSELEVHTLKPVNVGGYAAYQNRVLTQLRKYYPDADTSLDASTWEIMESFWTLDLSPVDLIMQDRYSPFGPEPRLPSDMLRSYLLSLKFKVTSVTTWTSCLKQNFLYAILSGFPVGDTPGIGTFYDFFDRLWLSDKDNISDPLHPPKQKPRKPQTFVQIYICR